MQSSPAARRNIWVVDDSRTDAERVKRLFSAESEVEVIHDSAGALERLSGGAIPDLLILDWVMPGVSGIEVCKFVRSAGGKLAQVPILLLTAEHGSKEIVEAFSSGANDYVSKPFVDAELKARTNALLEARHLLDRALKAEADLHTLLETAPDPIFAVDAQGKVSFVNEEGSRILGRPPREIIGADFGALLPGISISHIMVGPGESFLPLPDVQVGERIFAPSFRILPSDSAATTTVALRDVTSRRQAEARRLDFYSIIAHDLRTPITAVLLRLQLAFRGKHGVLAPSLLSDLHRTETSLRSLVGMINDFLELAKLEGVGYKINRQPLNLGDLFKATLEDFDPLMEKNGLTCKAIGLENQALVLGDRQRLTQVLSNLVGNAIKFNSDHGKITTSIICTDSQVEVAIEDTGRGIPADELPTIFERFSRARSASKDTPGTGLGLMIVKEIVEAHGGVIGVESQVGVGTRFWFRLPRYHGPAARTDRVLSH